MNLQARIKKIKLPPALRSRNYRLFFAGQGISLIGNWMTQVATIWLVYHLSDSPWMLGVVGFISQIPTLILLPFAGVLIDRWNRHRVLVVTQILAMVQSLALAFLALTGAVNIWQLLVLSLLSFLRARGQMLVVRGRQRRLLPLERNSVPKAAKC